LRVTTDNGVFGVYRIIVFKLHVDYLAAVHRCRLQTQLVFDLGTS
jgi:hypothetical protein